MGAKASTVQWTAGYTVDAVRSRKFRDRVQSAMTTHFSSQQVSQLGWRSGASLCASYFNERAWGFLVYSQNITLYRQTSRISQPVKASRGGTLLDMGSVEMTLQID